MQYQPLITDSRYFSFSPDKGSVSMPFGDQYYAEVSLSPKCVKGENVDAYVVTFEVPGVAKEEMEITISEGLIVINGMRDGKSVFSTVREIPCDVECDKVKAILKNGVLEVTFPKIKPIHVKVQ